MDVATPWTREHVDAIDEWNRRSHGYRGNWTPRIIFSKNVSFIPAIVSGKVGVNDSGIDRIDGLDVHFADGTAEEFDAILLCTGFIRDFSRLGTPVKDNDVRNLYKHAFDPDHGGRLAFIGFVRPFQGGIPICAEMQARYFALLCSNKLALPADVRDRIERDRVWEETMTALSPRHTESIPSHVLYLDSLAREIGCLMPVSRLIRHPRLLLRHWFHSFNQACYRLTGPHSRFETAREELMREEPGPLGTNIILLLYMTLSILPHFVHPRNIGGTAPGGPKPPPGSHHDRRHYLRWGEWKGGRGRAPHGGAHAESRAVAEAAGP
jgi:dimethylaniline monooxygenase (N-oxide forming)